MLIESGGPDELRYFLEDMETSELRELLRFLLSNYCVVDGFWFMAVEKRYEREIAKHLFKTVWGKIAGMWPEDLVKCSNIQEKGIQ